MPRSESFGAGTAFWDILTARSYSVRKTEKQSYDDSDEH